jgi:hypothetical protein
MHEASTPIQEQHNSPTYSKVFQTMLYHGTHTSLYKSLPSVVIPVLEDAILLTRLRLYDAAEQIFNHELSSYSHVPVVAIEHAEALLHRYKCFRILEVLDKVLEVLTTNDEEDRDVQRLIAIFRGVVKIQTEGIYEPALEEALRLQRDWASKSVDAYTDIQVSMGTHERERGKLLAGNAVLADSFV